MRRILSLLLCLVMLFSLTVPTFAAEKPIRIKLCNYTDPSDNWVGEKWVISRNDVNAFKKEYPNAKYIVSDTEAVIKNSRTMVPVRVIAEELGWKVDWNSGYISMYRWISNVPEINNSEYKYYKNYNQFAKFINLFYRLEGGKVDGFSEFSLTYDTNDKVFSIGEMVGTSKMFIYSIGFSTDSNVGEVGFLSRNSFDDYSNSLFSGAFYHIDTPAFIDKNNRTMIPLRAMGEMMGLSVSWNNAKRIVTISA